MNICIGGCSTKHVFYIELASSLGEELQKTQIISGHTCIWLICSKIIKQFLVVISYAWMNWIKAYYFFQFWQLVGTPKLVVKTCNGEAQVKIFLHVLAA
jgi:hypothetical protein